MDGFVLGGTASDVGKTVGALALIRALETAGYAVQPAKAGPDFIDPVHHERVAGRPSRTLDSWLQGVDGVRRNYYRGEGDICVVEGMMGLYDGDACSTAAVAAALDVPVVLVVDAHAGMESVAATALGFRAYAARTDHDVEVAGVLAQRAHGGVHERGIREALPDELHYVGRIPPREELTIPDRHLGLQLEDDAALDLAALDAAAEHVDVDRLLDIARPAARPDTVGGASTRLPGRTESQGASTRLAQSGTGQSSNRQTSEEQSGGTEATVAVAQDSAFCFCYPATLERLTERAEVVTFAPTEGEALPDCSGVYLPGGYPELYAESLASGPALDQLAERAADGLPVLGECGGLMALARSLTTLDGETYEMAGILPADVRMHERYRAIDHVALQARTGTLTASAGGTLHGHEFHYSSAAVDRDARFAFDVERGEGIDGDHDGLTAYRTLGTYAHVHPESGAFDAFLDGL